MEVLMPVTPLLSEFVPHSPQRELHARVKRHFGEYGDGFCNALDHVAGEIEPRKGFGIIADIATARDWHPAFTRRLAGLRGFLPLGHFDCPDDTCIFDHATLDPTSPETAACMWHADQLENLLDAADARAAQLAALPRDPRSLIRKPKRP
jgi:hypothetical protein